MQGGEPELGELGYHVLPADAGADANASRSASISMLRSSRTSIEQGVGERPERGGVVPGGLCGHLSPWARAKSTAIATSTGVARAARWRPG